MSKETGGPAFPQAKKGFSGTDNYHNRVDSVVDYYGGMTLRDYFAAKAMQGNLNGCLCKDCGEIEERAKEAYEIADAMLKERSK